MSGKKPSSQRALGQFKAPFEMSYGRLSLEECFLYKSLLSETASGDYWIGGYWTPQS